MEGKFTNRFGNIFIAFLSWIFGASLAIRFVIFSIEKFPESRASGVLGICITVLGVLLFGFGILRFLYNRKASLEITAKAIIIKSGLKKEFTVQIIEIFDSENKGKTLRLITNKNKIIKISGLKNAKELCEYLHSELSNREQRLDPILEEKNCKRYRKKHKFSLILALLVSAIIVGLLAWCFFTIGIKAFSDFTEQDAHNFEIFVLAEAICAACAFLLWRSVGRVRIQYNHCVKCLTRLSARAHKNDGLEKYSGLIATKYYSRGLYRIVIYTPNSSSFAYTLEGFDRECESWRDCYDEPKTFLTMEKLYSSIDTVFSDTAFDE